MAVAKSTWLLLTSALLMTCFLFRASEGVQRQRPNLIFILVDNMGFNDFGVHDSNMVTPTLDKMYNEGFRLNYTYTDPVGSSARASLFSGIFSIKMGMQAYRGFDSFFGQYTGKTDYYTMKTEEGFLDYRENAEVMTDPRFKNLYSTEVWSKRTINEINKHKKKCPKNDSPFFIMSSMTALQAPNKVPSKYIRKCRKGVFSNDERKNKCGMMAAVDQALFRILRALKKTNQEDNTLIFFYLRQHRQLPGGLQQLAAQGQHGHRLGRRHPRAQLHLEQEPGPAAQAEPHIQRDLPRGGLGNRKSFCTEFGYLVNEGEKNLAYIRQGDYKIVVNEEAFPGWYAPPFNFNGTELEEPTLNYNRRPFLLFNVRTDPSETNDISKSTVAKNAEARDDILELYEDFKAEYVAKVMDVVDSSPANHPEYNNVWSSGSC
ncbi:hypothetical protein ACOMHN_059890 [Nucella lapillus]